MFSLGFSIFGTGWLYGFINDFGMACCRNFFLIGKDLMAGCCNILLRFLVLHRLLPWLPILLLCDQLLESLPVLLRSFHRSRSGFLRFFLLFRRSLLFFHLLPRHVHEPGSLPVPGIRNRIWSSWLSLGLSRCFTGRVYGFILYFLMA